MITIRRLEWDAWNMEHIARHEVTTEEAEEVCFGMPVLLDSYKGRILAVGPTIAGRMLAVALDPEPGEQGACYPVSARPASRRERQRYVETRGGEQA